MRNALRNTGRITASAMIAAAALTTFMSPFVSPGPAIAGEASVLDVVVSARANGTYNFSVTIAHKDEG